MKKSKSKIKDSSGERRKKFNKWVSVPMMKECGALPTINANCKPIWKPEEETIPCSKCNHVYGSVYKDKDDKYYCIYCCENIKGLEEYKNCEKVVDSRI